MQRLQIKVVCPLDHTRHPVEIVYVTKDDGTRIPLPCRGCDNRHDTKTCQKCALAITLMFFRGDDFKTNDVVTPDFSTVQ